ALIINILANALHTLRISPQFGKNSNYRITGSRGIIILCHLYSDNWIPPLSIFSGLFANFRPHSLFPFSAEEYHGGSAQYCAIEESFISQLLLSSLLPVISKKLTK